MDEKIHREKPERTIENFKEKRRIFGKHKERIRFRRYLDKSYAQLFKEKRISLKQKKQKI